MNETESMINSLNPCLAYKSSGVPWLGDVPTHWEIRRLRAVADMRVSNGKLSNSTSVSIAGPE